MSEALSLIGTRIVGLDATSSPEDLSPGRDGNLWLTAAENMRFYRVGAASTRPGFEQRIDLGTSAKVDSMGAHENAQFAKSGTKIYYSTDNWATKTDSGETRTASAVDFFYGRQDEMFAINGTDGLLRFASDYTTPDTLTSVVGTCIAELDNSMLVGNGDILKYSAPATEANPEFFYDFSANGAGSKKMPSTIRALKAGSGIVLIGMAQGIHYAYAFDLDTGGLLTRTLTDAGHGVPNAYAISYIENNLFAIFTGRRILLAVADAAGVRLLDDPFKQKESFDYPIRAYLLDADADQSLSFTHYDPAARELHVCYLENGISKILVCSLDTGRWARDTGKVFSCMVNWENRVYAGDDSDDLIHLDGEGMTDNGIEIAHRLVTPEFNLDDKRSTFEALGWVMGGLLSPIGEFTVRFRVDGAQVFTQTVTAAELIAKGLMSLQSGVFLGRGQTGSTGIGFGGSSPTAYRFTFPIEFLYECESFQVEIEIFDAGTAFELRDCRLDLTTDGVLLADSF